MVEAKLMAGFQGYMRGQSNTGLMWCYDFASPSYPPTYLGERKMGGLNNRDGVGNPCTALSAF